MERQAARVECADIDHAQALLTTDFVTTDFSDLCKSIYTDQRKAVLLVICEPDISVDTLGGDACSACADACPVVAAFRLFDLDVRHFGNDFSIHAAGIEVGVHV